MVKDEGCALKGSLKKHPCTHASSSPKGQTLASKNESKDPPPGIVMANEAVVDGDYGLTLITVKQ
jgi:hypothetical protein